MDDFRGTNRGLDSPQNFTHRNRSAVNRCQGALGARSTKSLHENTACMRGLLVHCNAGMSRSPAIAILALCHLQPAASPFERMTYVESCSRCEYIWPNPLVVELGDRIMQRNGEIVRGVDRWRRAKEPASAE